MLGLLAILVIIGASAAVDFQGLSIPNSFPPLEPYYQSEVAFSQVRLYLKGNVPVENGNFNDSDVQRHRVNGLLVAVTDALVEALKNSDANNPCDPLEVVDQVLPQAWREYNTLAARPINKLLSEAQAKIQPVSQLIQGLCITKTVDECNGEIQNRVIAGSPYLKRRARLLLLLGDVSEIFLNRQNDIERIVNEALSLFKEVRSYDFTRFVRKLSAVKDQIRATNPTDVN